MGGRRGYSYLKEGGPYRRVKLRREIIVKHPVPRSAMLFYLECGHFLVDINWVGGEHKKRCPECKQGIV